MRAERMTVRNGVSAALAGLCFVGGVSVAVAAGGRSFEEGFPLLTKRNIFDPERREEVVREYRPAAPVPAPRPTGEPVRRETVALVGTALSGTNRFAHFVGSSPEYTCIRSVGESVAGLLVRDISLNEVVLMSAAGPLEISVGGNVGRLGAGAWAVGAGTDVGFGGASSGGGFGGTASGSAVGGAAGASASSSRESGGAGGGGPPAVSPGGSALSDLMKRLMERRQKELTR